jgi:excisionase family DNA binding protein
MNDAAAASPRLMTLRQAAAFIGVHPNSLRTYVRTGLVPATKIGRDWRFIEADLVDWIRARYPEPARMQPSADRKEASSWHSGNVQAYITSNSQHLTERALDGLLARPTGKRPKNITTS